MMAADRDTAFKIAAKPLQIETWLLLTAYRSSSSPYPTVSTAPSPTSYNVPFSHNTTHTICIAGCVMTFQSHPRSMVFVSPKKGLCNFLLVVNSTLCPTCHHFWNTVTYRLKNAYFSYPIAVSAQIRCFACPISLTFRNRRAVLSP